VARGLFVTGTDTEIGKTLVAAGLIHAYRRLGLRAAGMKPAAAGCRDTPRPRWNDDVQTLLAAANVAAPLEEVNPYLFDEWIAPHIAAARHGVEVSLDVLEQRFQALARRADAVVVEGAGGLLVPLNEREDFAHLAVRLGLPVVLTVGMRLGCINHALLTQEAILSRGLRFAGWVANRIDPAMHAAEENLATLKAKLHAPLLADLPYLDPPDPQTIRIALPAEA